MRNGRIFWGSLALAATVAAPSRVAAQDTTYHVVDRIVAVVGGKPILLSQVNEEINIRRATGGKVPPDSAGLEQMRRSVIEGLVNDELVVQTAQRDTTILLSVQDVQSAVDEAMKTVRGQFASDIEFQRQLRAAGFGTADDYRTWLYDKKRRENLQSQLIAKLRRKGILKPVPPTEAEVRDLAASWAPWRGYAAFYLWFALQQRDF